MTGLHAALAHIVTRYDRAQSKRRDYNPYALSQYLGRAEEVAEAVTAGAPLDDALARAFNGPLLKYLRDHIKEEA